MLSREEKEYRIALGQSLRRYRELMGLSMNDVNNTLGINKGALNGYEKGTRKVPLEKIDQLARLYRMKPSIIFQDTYDRIDYGYTLDWNDFLTIEFGDNRNELIIKSKMNKQQEVIQLSHQNIHFIETKFRV
ncbi:helix-turn-helix domain-containing protein [Staphylococcus simulans]|uniref:helix-turn-helix domain-containing protein n=1 Tax=Staphylococcus simulans TaxID=1286 RepID=UPI0021CEB75D|nr:helix-turn-helix domain-containing protein [Staphylococcus simulans]UXR50989.1 helix-turn-helix domain-containing protein [Staphylococcus simulans]